MKAQMQKGFTLIELMIVVAIIGILAAIAIPQYQDYIARTQASEAASLLGGMKTPIAETWANTGSFIDPASNSSVTSEGKYVDAITLEASTTNTASYQAAYKTTGVSQRIASKTIGMHYDGTAGSFSFSCDSLDDAVKPKNCD